MTDGVVKGLNFKSDHFGLKFRGTTLKFLKYGKYMALVSQVVCWLTREKSKRSKYNTHNKKEK